MRCNATFPKCRIFSLMVLKNLKKQRRQKLTFLTAILSPVIFSIFIILLRSEQTNFLHSDDIIIKNIQFDVWWQGLIDKISHRRDQMINEHSSFKSNVFIPSLRLGYAPNTTAGIRKLFREALRSKSVPRTEIYSFNDCEELRIHAYSEHYIASICFHNVDESMRGLPLKLHFSIIMPAELRMYDDTWIGNNWKMNNVFDTHPENYIDINNSSYSSYVREGFISLQYFITSKYLQLASGNTKIPQIQLRSFQLNNNVHELIKEGVDISVLVLLLGFMFPVTIITMEIVEERTLGLHFALNTNNTGTRLQFAAWYFNGVFLLLITCMIFILVLKIEWIGSSSVFNKCPWYIVLFFFTSFVFSAVAFALLLAVIIGSTKMVVALVPIYWLLTAVPLLTTEFLESSWSNFILIISTMLCNVTMCRGLRRILCLEHYIGELNIKQYLISSLIGTDPTLLMFIGMFYLQTLLYILLALILDGNVFPCLRKLFKCTSCRNLLVKFRKYMRQREREKEKTKELKEDLSRRHSDVTEQSEVLTKTVRLYNKIPLSILPPNRELTRNTILDSSSDESSSTSASINVKPEDKKLDTINQQLSIWLSGHELRHDASENSTKFHLQQSSNVLEYSESSDNSESHSQSQSESEKSDSIDDDRPIVIEFKNVYKKYIKTLVIRNFSLKIYENETTVLLGHNASGKTTILNMLCGNVQADSGSIFIYGYNVVKRPSQAFEHVGTALHNLHLFNEFTFSEHLIYICRLRGLSLSQSQNDVDSYLSSIRMEHLRQIHVKNLTTGQRRLLQMLCAFAGRKKIVLLNKPMEGVDIEKRQLFYDFAKKEMRFRTIFMVTNFPNVASNVGDRIGILVNGSLYACGNERTLLRTGKKIFRLICYLGIQCDFSKLFNFFANHIPSIELESKMGDSAVFCIEYFDFSKLIKLMRTLPDQMKVLSLDSYQLSTSTLEYILLNAMTHKHIKSTASVKATLQNLSDRIRHIAETKHSTNRNQFLADFKRMLSQLEVVIRKRFLMDMRNYLMAMLQIFLPSLLCAWTLSTPHIDQEREPLFAISLNYFNNSITLLKQKGSLDPVLAACKHLLSHATLGQSIIEVNPDDEFVDYMSWYMDKHYIITDLKFVVAVTFTDEFIEVLYNSNLMSSGPIAMTLIMDALAVGFVNPSAGISVKLDPLPYSTLHTVYMAVGANCLDWVFCMTMSFSFCIVWVLPLLNFGRGRSTPYSRIELIGGMRFSTLSLANFIYGMLKVLLSLIPLNAVILLFNSVMPWTLHDNYVFIYIILAAALYVTSADILISYWLTELRIAYLVIITIYSIGIVIYLAIYELADVHLHELSNIMALNFHPYYALVHNLIKSNNDSETMELCADVQTFETSVYLEQCQRVPNCCHQKVPDYILIDHMWYSYAGIFVIWVFLYTRFLQVNVKKFKPKNQRGKFNCDSDPDSLYDQTMHHFYNRNDSDNTWINEKIFVRTLERPLVRTKALTVENLGVFFRENAILNRINLLVERFQVMSVLGMNASGKTVLIKTILGAIPHSKGSINSFGNHTYQYKEQENFKNVGYCAQNNEIEDALTIMETISAVLLIRGLKKPSVLNETKTLLKIFDLYNCRYHLLPQCSRGVLKRVCIALSLIGYAGLILMDDPFSYLDESGRRYVYSIIEAQCSNGQAVLFTSPDARTCDLANRTAILKSPSIIVIGERQELQLNEYACYIVIETRVKIETQTKNRLFSKEYNASWTSEKDKTCQQICSIIENIFPHAIIKTTNPVVCFWLSTKTYNMAYILEMLHKYENTFYPFSIASPSLRTTYAHILKNSYKTTEILENEDL